QIVVAQGAAAEARLVQGASHATPSALAMRLIDMCTTTRAWSAHSSAVRVRLHRGAAAWVRS
ncbi:MAG: hypothetical protein Q4D79_04200, partial [Propionibacteriaceae bacterium]|nr:hypothetical protein [Propionibacteriaceae bacterium]